MPGPLPLLVPARSQQLPLPLGPVTDPVPAAPHSLTAILAPQQVWRSLSPTAQAQVRRTLLQLVQEVTREPAER